MIADPENIKIVASINHEIKNSLNPLITLSGILLRDREKKFSDKEREYFEIINRNSKKILKIVEQISLLNKLRQGIFKPEVSQINLRDFFSQLTQSKELNISFELLLNEDILNIDNSVFNFIFEDLLEVYRVSGAKTLRIVVNQKNEKMLFHVSDTATADLSEDDYRPLNSYCDEFSENAILWLYFIHEFAHFSGGRFIAKKNYDGLQCCLVLSLLTDGTNALKELEVKESSIRDFSIVVIDDDADNHVPIAAIVEHEFAGAGKVFFAHNGHDGIDLVSRVRPEIVLLDISLPDISGMSLVRSIRNFFADKNSTIIAFSGHEMAFNKEVMEKAGFDDVILKPFNIDEFVARLKYWVSKNE